MVTFFENYNITAKILTLINQSYSDFQFYLYSVLCVCSIQFCHLCRFTYLPPQSRYQTVPTLQGFLILPLFNHVPPQPHLPGTLLILNPLAIFNVILSLVMSLSLVIFFALKSNINITIHALFKINVCLAVFPFFYFLPTYFVESNVTFL